MKLSLLLFLLIFYNLSFALPCPNGKGILYKGDSIEEVLKQCGEPNNKHSVTTTLYSLKRLIYYRPHPYNVGGHSQLIILFKNNKVSNIHINEHYTYYMCRQSAVQVGLVTTVQTSCGDWDYYAAATNLCGSVFSINDSLEQVLSLCGKPAEQSDLATNNLVQTEFTYKGSTPQTIIFQNGKLVDWK